MRTREEKLNMLSNPRINAFIHERDKMHGMLFSVLSRDCLHSITHHKESIELLTLLKEDQASENYFLLVRPHHRLSSSQGIHLQWTEFSLVRVEVILPGQGGGNSPWSGWR